VILRPNSRSCRTASIRSGIAGGLAGELVTALRIDGAGAAEASRSIAAGDRRRLGRRGARHGCSL
jgi:hypothetical protein